MGQSLGLLCRERQANPDPGCYQWHWVSGGRSASLAIVRRSKTALLAIINNILDLASIDAGAMTLNLGSVDIRKAMEARAFYRHPPYLTGAFHYRCRVCANKRHL